MTPNLHLRIPPDLMQKIEEIRDAMGPKPSMNALVVHILMLWVEDHD